MIILFPVLTGYRTEEPSKEDARLVQTGPERAFVAATRV